MSTIIEQAVTSTPEELRKQMIRLLRAADDGSSPSRIRRIEIQVAEMDPLLWLGAQRNQVKGYWSDRDAGWEVAAIGEADELKGGDSAGCRDFFDRVEARLQQSDEHVRYYGGFRFGPWHAKDQSWRPFGAFRFILPQVEITRRGDQTFLACNLPVGGLSGSRIEAWVQVIEAMVWPSASAAVRLPPSLGRLDEPAPEAWNKDVADILQLIKRGDLDKLVLARRSCFEFGQPLDAFSLLRRLKDGTPGCFHFCGNHGGVVAFMGASPERLFRRRGREVSSEAVAGTRSRGSSPENDKQLERDLLHSAKDLAEHRYVMDSIEEALKPLCEELTVSQPLSVLKLTRVQHLMSSVEGRLRSGVRDADILEQLHPTPAVGGHPRARALQEISRLESFDRGWYAGPVGWVARDAVEFAVAIRCGVIAGSRLCLFSGAGIVEGSVPGEEWDEVESKIGNFLSVLTGS